jgi:cyclohexadienyl dehydratase
VTRWRWLWVLLWAAAAGLALRALPTVSAQPALDGAERDLDPLFALLGQRLALMPEVAAAKWHDHLPVADPAREEALLEATAQRARELGIEPDSTRTLLALQMSLARALQERLFERWSRAEKAPAPTRALKTELRPELDRLGEALLRALVRALPVLPLPETAAMLEQRTAALLSTHGLARDQAAPLARALAGLCGLPEARLTRIRAAGLLRVGTTFDYAPFSSEQSGAPRGIDIELAQGFARALGVELRLVRTSWPTLLADYARDAFDLAASGISVTPERARVARFSIPYHAGGKTPIARCEARARFDTLAEIDSPDVRVIVNPGGTNEQYVRGALQRAQILLFPDNRAIFGELVARRADVMITDDIEATLQARRNPALCRTMRGLLTKADKAWLVQADAALLAEVDGWLGKQLRSGAVARALARQMR